MKKLLLLLLFPLMMLSQDNVILQSGEELSVKITEVSDAYIKYKKLDFIDGPNFTINTIDVFMIKYSNGDKQVFNNNKAAETVKKINASEETYGLVEEGTIVPLYCVKTLDSKNLQVGSLVEFRVRSAVLNKDGYVLIAANEIVYATVNAVSKAKSLGKQGSLSFMIQDIKAVDGQKVSAYLNLSTQGDNRGGAAIGVGVLLFWPALFVKGKEAEVKAGTLINAVISENKKIKINAELRLQEENIDDNPAEHDATKEGLCGPKPENLNPNINTPYPKNSKRYKKYLQKLQEWEDCMGIKRIPAME